MIFDIYKIVTSLIFFISMRFIYLSGVEGSNVLVPIIVAILAIISAYFIGMADGISIELKKEITEEKMVVDNPTDGDPCEGIKIDGHIHRLCMTCPHYEEYISKKTNNKKGD